MPSKLISVSIRSVSPTQNPVRLELVEGPPFLRARRREARAVLRQAQHERVQGMDSSRNHPHLVARADAEHFGRGRIDHDSVLGRLAEAIAGVEAGELA